MLLLARKLGMTRADHVLDLVAQRAGARLLTPQVQFFVEAVLDAHSASGEDNGA